MRVIAAMLLGAPFIAAQPTTKTEFEVASVRRNTLEDRIVTIDVGPGDRFTCRGYTLVLLIQRAYGVMDWNVTGGPSWIRTDRWDISAKSGTGVPMTEQQLKPMLRALLAERFQLKLHESSKEMPGYALIVARGGLKAKPSSNTDEHIDSFRFNRTGLTGQVSMANFARFVTGKVGVIGIDETGLKGLYDFKADWIDPAAQTGVVPAGVDPREDFRASVFEAIEKQLGLKFNQQKILVPTLVINSVERSSEN